DHERQQQRPLRLANPRHEPELAGAGVGVAVPVESVGPLLRDEGQARRGARAAGGAPAGRALPAVAPLGRPRPEGADRGRDARHQRRGGLHHRHPGRHAPAGGGGQRAARRPRARRLRVGSGGALRRPRARHLLLAEPTLGRPVLRYLVQRVLLMVPTLFAISLLTFVIIQLPPGNYLDTLIADLRAAGETADLQKAEFLRKQYGLDQPVWVQYGMWLQGLLHGDLGYSFEYDRPVSAIIGERLALTFVVSFAAILFTWLMAFPIGVYSATHQYSWGDHGLTFLGFLGLATPNFLLALVL